MIDEYGAVSGIELAGETEVHGENLAQYHYVHHKSHMAWPGIKPLPPQWETGDKQGKLKPHKELNNFHAVCTYRYHCVCLFTVRLTTFSVSQAI
jgi:hypothetical protein